EPPPLTTFGGRRVARTVFELAPWRPTGFAPAATRAAQRSTFILPATIIFMTSSVSVSVTRRPPMIFGVWPSFFWSSVAWGPPPWTRTTGTFARRISATSAAIRGMYGPWTTSPPSLMMTGPLFVADVDVGVDADADVFEPARVTATRPGLRATFSRPR